VVPGWSADPVVSLVIPGGVAALKVHPEARKAISAGTSADVPEARA
jgi:hypothetical protein